MDYDYHTYAINHVYVKESGSPVYKLAYVSLDPELAHKFSESEKAQGNETKTKSYVTNDMFMSQNSEYIDGHYSSTDSYQ